MPVGPEHDDAALHKAGEHRGHGRAHHAQGGGSQLAEDEDIIEAQIHQHRGDARAHGHDGLPGLPQGAGIDLGHGEGGDLHQHHRQVVLPVAESRCQIQRLLPLVEEEGDQFLPKAQEHPGSQADGDQREPQLRPHGAANAFLVPLAVELGGEDANACKAAEEEQVQHKEQLVHNGDAGHGLRAHLAHHQIVQQAHKIGDQILHQHGNHDRRQPPVEGAIPDISPQAHRPPHKE